VQTGAFGDLALWVAKMLQRGAHEEQALPWASPGDVSGTRGRYDDDRLSVLEGGRHESKF
jgi:hypothetical protein